MMVVFVGFADTMVLVLRNSLRLRFRQRLRRLVRIPTTPTLVQPTVGALK